MKKRLKIISVLLVFVMIATTITVVLAAPTINLSSSTSGNTANLSWTNNDTVKSYNYNVKKSVNGGAFANLNENAANKINVLNVYPDNVDQTISFTTYDGESINIKKSASLKRWMEEANGTDSRGYGRGLIEVTPVSITAFNNNPSAYLYKNSNGKYNYQVVVFGTWDANGNQDISTAATNVMNTYLAEGNSCVVGHDTIMNSDPANRNFTQLRSYFNLKFQDYDGVTGPGGTAVENINGNSGSATTQVTLRTNNVFTTYPWYIGKAGDVLTVPHCHTVGQIAYGNVEISFTSTGDRTDQNGQGNWNYYLTVNNNCAMIQTGHSNCEATQDEQKIWANLLFYLGDVNTATTATDPNFKDIDAPNIPNVTSNTLTGVNGTATYTAEDNGTTYKYYVEAIERTTNEKTSSNTVTEIRKTGVAGYSYVIDTNPNTTVDGTIDTTSSSINYTLGNGPKTYLHIRAIDGAGNAGPTAHVLLHTNVPPELALSQNPTYWTNQNVTITAVGTDSDGTVVSITKPNGQVATGSTTTYVVEENGEYTFTATDNSGATTSKTIEITNIDKFAPWGSATITQPTKEVRAAVINMSAMDDLSGVAKIIKPDGTEVTSTSTTYNVTKPGTYTFRIIDRAGNEGRLNVNVVIRSDGVVVKYVDVEDGNREIAGKTYLTGNVEEDYTTTPKTINNYELVNVPSNANGKFTIDEQTVVYGYKLISYVTVRCVDENTNRILYLSEPVKYLQGDTYRTTRREIEGYTYTRVDKAEEAQVGREDITVTYYYKKNTSVTVKYVDMLDNNREIHEALPIPGLQGDNYTTDSIEIPGYAYISSQGVVEGKMGSEPSTVVYKYKKLANLVTEHIDANTGEKITEDVTTTYKEGDTYEALAQNIPGYVVVEEPEEKTGIMGRDEIRKQYYYKKISKGLVVKYVDVKTNEVLDREIYEGNENDKITLETKQFLHYVLHSKPDMDEILLTPEAKELVYYYRRTVEMDVVGIDVDTGEELYATQISGREDDNYSTIAKPLDEYEIVGKDKAEGIFERLNTRIEFLYKKINQEKYSTILLKYVDKDTSKVLKSETITAKVGDKYSTEKLEFAHYDFVEVVGLENGVVTEEAQEVTYYYTKKTGKVIVIYEDEDGKIIKEEEITGKVEEDYKVEIEEIDGYKIVERPTNTQGKITEETIEVKVKVQKIPEEIKTGKVVVIYEDENGKVLKREESVGNVGQNYKVEIEEIDGYELVGKPEKTEGKYIDGTIEIKVKFKKIVVSPATKGTIVVKYLDEEGNVIMEDTIKEGTPGEDFYIKLPEIDGYKIIGDDTIIAQFVDGKLVFNAVYEKIEEPKEDNIPDTGDINITLILTIFTLCTAVVSKKAFEK